MLKKIYNGVSLKFSEYVFKFFFSLKSTRVYIFMGTDADDLLSSLFRLSLKLRV